MALGGVIIINDQTDLFEDIMKIKLFIIKIRNFFRQSFISRALLYAFLAFLFLRIFSSIVLLIGIIQPNPVAPYSEISQEILFNLESKNFFTRYFLAPWYRWDTTHYLEIVDFGYEFDIVNTVWPPMYPFLVKLVNILIKPSFLAAIVISNLFSILAFVLLFLYTKEILDEKTAYRTLGYLIIFPTAFYFIAGYSESLFLAFSVLVFLFLRRKKWLYAGLVSTLATLTRVQGLLLIIPIGIELIIELIETRNLNNFFLHSLSCLFAPFAYGIYSLYVYFCFNAPWPWETLSIYWEQHFGFPWEGIIAGVSIILGKEIYIDVTPTLVKVLNIVLPLFSVYLLIRIRKKISISLLIYSLTMLLVIMGKIDDNNALVSTIRYIITIFPIFIAQALIINKKILTFSIFVISIGLQIILLVYFYWWVWVA